jgi:N-acetylmuramoyl-L-alanine amidase
MRLSWLEKGGGLLAAVAAAGVVVCAGVSHGAESAAAPIKLRFGGDAAQTRVVLELDQAASAEVASDGSDGHVTLNFSHLSVGDSLDGQGKGLVRAWSLGKAGGRAVLSLDLGAHAKIRRRFLLPPSDGVTVYRYVLDIEADGPATASKPTVVAQAASPQAASPQASSPQASSPQASSPQAASPQGKAGGPQPVKAQVVRVTAALPPQIAVDPEAPDAPALQKTALNGPGPLKAVRAADLAAGTTKAEPARTEPAKSTTRSVSAPRKIIVIDAGHGGHDPGALGGRSHEKDVTLAAAKALRARLERTGRFKVVMTRDSDVYIPLEDRVKVARGAGADLFISLHADSGGDPKVRGATVYTLSDHGVDRTAKSVFNGGFINVQLPGRDLSVKQILLDLTQRTTRNRSGAFAETLLEHISTRTTLLRRSHRDAGYMVLLAPDVPAVLLEMGFITNPEDETALNDRDRREKLMDAVGESIEAYFDKPVQVAER